MELSDSLLHENELTEKDKVLLVDDDSRVLAAYWRNLWKISSVKMAKSAKEGLERLDEQGPFAVIVADYSMPGMDGIEFLSKVAERHLKNI